ncbi:histone H3-like centromeric protein A [Melospiza melodia melodia]|uniref:histone H3-like centromeric protein A n=1 Tax=Melospiza melodia melodia TaxID=1914991 RepID=UPI002FD092AE
MPRPKPTPRRRGRSPAPPSSPPLARRCHPGRRALQEIRKYQSSTRLLLCFGPFARLVQELCLLITRDVDCRWQSMALLALQEAAEAFMTRLLEEAYLFSLHTRRVTLFPRICTWSRTCWDPSWGASE